MARTPDSELRRTLLKLSEKQDWVPMHIQPFEEVQGKAAYGFTVLGASAEPAVPALIAMLEDENFEVRVLAAFCLYRIGPAAKDAVPALQKFLEAATHSKVHPQRSWHERYWPARVLGAIGLAARPALPQLRALTNDADLLVRESAHAALIKITGEGLDPFVAMLKDSSNLTNWLSAARVVQLVGTNAAAAIPFLVPALQYTNQSMCGNAIQALGTIHMQPEVCIPALTPFLQATNDWLRLHTLEAIREFGRSAGPALPTAEIIRCLQDSSGLVRQQATNTLRQVAPEAAAKAGVDLLKFSE
jgi:HEAT repeat protein